MAGRKSLPKIKPVSKVCRKCETEKKADCFAAKSDSRDGLQSYCRTCDNKRKKKRYKAKPDAWRSGDYRRKYGITLEDWETLFQSQDGKCAICKTSEPGGRGNRFHVDHCHDTGEVRGLLCYRCNTAIGLMKHDLNTIESATLYLRGTNA